jgi:SAM-dependent methyltransferase
MILPRHAPSPATGTESSPPEPDAAVIKVGPPVPTYRQGSPAARLLYAFTIFASAFLLFQVQPLIAKMIVPWFGGAAAVWTTCLLFFQIVLLLGYLYAHWLTQQVHGKLQGRIHVVLLAGSLLVLPILPSQSWKPTGPEAPALHVLLLLAATVGLPYFLLSTTSPLLQAWYAQERGERAYRFYALSNAGSMLALLSYPVLVEPVFSTRHQAVGWSLAYGVICAACAVVAFLPRRQVISVEPQDPPPRPGWETQTLWVALAACGSTFLLAITNHLSQNVAAIPLLWVVPLSLYLLSFVLCFEGHAWYRRNIFLRLLAVALGAMAYALSPEFLNASLILLIPLYCLGLFVCCMVCHGELARLKPHPAYLTRFYLMSSLGGALGGIFVGLLAPHWFSGYFELPVAIAGCAILVLIVLHRDRVSPFYRARFKPAWLVVVTLVLLLNANLLFTIHQQKRQARVMVRNFYGALQVIDFEPVRIVWLQGNTERLRDSAPTRRKLMNGTIEHGLEFLSPELRRQPTAYYSQNSGVGRALRAAAKAGPLRVGVIGLGVGTLAAYGRPGDHYTFYEINPQVITLAERDFYFLRDSPARIDIVRGDARLSLERERPQGFDVLAVDAFSGDAIPVHLLTRQAFELYFRHLKPGGILAVHISNNYLNLEPVVERAAAWLEKPAVKISNGNDDRHGVFRSSWILLSDRPESLDAPDIKRVATVLPPRTDLPLWTDDYSNLFGVVKWVMK